MLEDGWDCQEYDLYNQQQHGELELQDRIDIRRNGSRAGGHQERNFSRCLLVTTTAYSDHVTLDPSTTKNESWIETGKGHEAH